MQTAEKKAYGVPGVAERNNNSVKTQIRPSLTGKEAKDETTQNQPAAQGAQIEADQTAQTKTGNFPAMDNQFGSFNQPASEITEHEKVPKQEVKPVLSLDAKLKAVDDLHRKSLQRLALIARIKTLEAFEVKLIEEQDELEANPYQGCKLIIKDDRNREFVTNTPNLIRMVTQYIFDACENKLAEIEATINFPQA